ncbi:putative lactoylglutathione lyase [Paraburkholderia bannensis]|uniref:Putative lactoylglutathione lyase n=1 Tax=Paraburkholderia bannensis TaxID=765414 RepID=A0A7W9WWW7_9BURK|nr:MULTISPECIES: VOC family protein [Paraburkholderia]MBB3262067.1 putative lactoylglutathione lyase [Paraburkholderia sp. WP4_3_2]MBB6107051.1 putative lactoylglutathione lyase [Paraburkholderia bannensis]
MCRHSVNGARVDRSGVWITPNMHAICRMLKPQSLHEVWSTLPCANFLRLLDSAGIHFGEHAMKLRTVYLKVSDMEKSATFWERLLGHEPLKRSEKWTEFMIGANRLGLLLNDFGDEIKGSNAVPVFEFEENSLHEFVRRATENGASIVMDGLKIESMKSIVLSTPDGHEFELCMCHN